MITAKFKCVKSTQTEASDFVEFTPVYSADKDSVNYSWSQATPSGQLQLSITNKDAMYKFIPGKEYFITIDDLTSQVKSQLDRVYGSALLTKSE